MAYNATMQKLDLIENLGNGLWLARDDDTPDAGMGIVRMHIKLPFDYYSTEDITADLEQIRANRDYPIPDGVEVTGRLSEGNPHWLIRDENGSVSIAEFALVEQCRHLEMSGIHEALGILRGRVMPERAELG